MNIRLTHILYPDSGSNCKKSNDTWSWCCTRSRELTKINAISRPQSIRTYLSFMCLSKRLRFRKKNISWNLKCKWINFYIILWTNYGLLTGPVSLFKFPSCHSFVFVDSYTYYIFTFQSLFRYPSMLITSCLFVICIFSPRTWEYIFQISI